MENTRFAYRHQRSRFCLSPVRSWSWTALSTTWYLPVGKSSQEEYSTIFQMFSGSFSAISLLTITAIGVERYLALKLHLRHQEVVTVRRVVYVLVLIWVCSIVAAYSCLWYGAILFYKAASPVIVMCLLINIFVYQKLYRVCRVHHARIRDQAMFLDEQLHQRAIAEVRFRKSVKTILLILLALILCYLPFCCFTLAIITVTGDFERGDGYAMLQTLYLFT